MTQVALFVDAENWCGDPAALDALCRRHGTPTVRRAYADWSRPDTAAAREALATAGLELVQATRLGAVQKNAVDVRLVVDAVESLHTRPHVGAYVLVTGDSDYVPLVQRLREHGKHVVGAGRAAGASTRLAAACSEYHALDGPRRAPDPAPVDLPLRHDVATLLAALDQLGATTGGSPVVAATLKSRMLDLDAGFDHARHGVRTFSAFLALAPVAAVADTTRRHDGQPVVRSRTA